MFKMWKIIEHFSEFACCHDQASFKYECQFPTHRVEESTVTEDLSIRPFVFNMKIG